MRFIRSTILGCLLGIACAGIPCAGAAAVEGAKFAVTGNGLYQVTEQQIADALGVSAADVSNGPLRVEHLGFPVGAVRTGSNLVFYANGYNSLYTDLNVYRILQETGVEPSQQAVSGAAGVPQESFTVTNRYEQQASARIDIFYDPAEEPWLWAQLVSGLINSFTHTFELEGLLPGSGGMLTVYLKGASPHIHGARISLNGSLLGNATITGYFGETVELAVPPGLLLAAGNVLLIEADPPPGTTFDRFFVDAFDVAFEHRYTAYSNELVFAADAGSVKVGGFATNAIEVWDIGNLWEPVLLSGVNITSTGGGWCVDFEAPASSRYIASDHSNTNFTIGPWYTAALKATGHAVDYLAVYGPGLASGAAELVAYRQAQGLDAMAVSAESVFNEFNHGIFDGRVLKTFLSYAYYQWAKGPRYFCLIGDGTLDYKNVTGTGDSMLPTEPEGSPYGIFSSDNKVGDVDNDNFIEVAVGRLPVSTPQHLTNFLVKLQQYESGSAWRTNVLITTDNQDAGGSYIGEGDLLESIITNRQPVLRADIEVIGLSNTVLEIERRMEDGTDMFIFVGHGNSYQMAQEPIMNIASFNAISNEARPTLVGALSCLIGAFSAPNLPSLGKTMMNDEHGAVGVFGSAQLITLAECSEISRVILGRLYRDGTDRFGDAWIDAKNVMAQTNLFRANRNYQYMGDPALAVGDPNAPRGGVPPAPGAAPYSVWQDWAFPPIWRDLGIASGPGDNPDGDQLTNDEERVTGSDPVDEDSELVIVSIIRAGDNQAQLIWPSFAGRSYRVEKAGSAAEPYTLLADNVAATPPINALTDTNAVDAGTVYRVYLK